MTKIISKLTISNSKIILVGFDLGLCSCSKIADKCPNLLKNFSDI